MTAMAILKRHSGLADNKEIFFQLDDLAQKKNALMSRYEDNKAQFEELIQYCQNYEQGREEDGAVEDQHQGTAEMFKGLFNGIKNHVSELTSIN